LLCETTKFKPINGHVWLAMSTTTPRKSRLSSRLSLPKRQTCVLQSSGDDISTSTDTPTSESFPQAATCDVTPCEANSLPPVLKCVPLPSCDNMDADSKMDPSFEENVIPSTVEDPIAMCTQEVFAPSRQCDPLLSNAVNMVNELDPASDEDKEDARSYASQDSSLERDLHLLLEQEYTQTQQQSGNADEDAATEPFTSLLADHPDDILMMDLECNTAVTAAAAPTASAARGHLDTDGQTHSNSDAAGLASTDDIDGVSYRCFLCEVDISSLAFRQRIMHVKQCAVRSGLAVEQGKQYLAVYIITTL